MTSSHSNDVTLNSDLIENIEYIDGTFLISDGQPYESGPTPKDLGTGVWQVTVNCGRHKTSDVADAFDEACGGQYHEFAGYHGGGTPDELNFMYGLKITFANAAPVTLYLGQGSSSSRNNWWIGGANVINDGKPDLILISNDLPVQVLRLSGGVSNFDFESIAAGAGAARVMAGAR